MNPPPWFERQLEDLKAARPKWAKGLPEIQTRAGEVISGEDSVWILGAALFVEKEAVRHDLLEELRRHGDPASLDAWLGAALTAWAGSKTAAKDVWMLNAVPPLAGAGSVKIMDAIIRGWVRAKEKALALRTLDALGRANVREAKELMPVLALCVKDHAVSQEAGRVQRKQAAATGLGAVEAADAVVPTLGLDSRGELKLDYGNRIFTARLNSRLEMELLDHDGRVMKSLPAGRSTDDATKVRQAKETWSGLKTGLKRLIRVQARRLEESMIHGHSWSLSALGKSWLSHPVLSRLARSVVWHSGGLRLRITEDHGFATVEDDPVTPEADARLRVAHPLSLDTAELAAWRQVFADYRLFQMVPQLDRETYRVPADGPASKRSAAPPHAPLSPGVLFGILENDGWRLQGSDGVFSAAWKSFQEESVTAWITFTGLLAGRLAESQPQHLHDCFFQAGRTGPDESIKPGSPLPLSEVPPVAYSETLRRLHRLCQAGQEI